MIQLAATRAPAFSLIDLFLDAYESSDWIPNTLTKWAFVDFAGLRC